MSQIITLFKKKYPEFGTHKMTIEDFRNICSAENINTWNDNIPGDRRNFIWRVTKAINNGMI